MHRSVAIRPQSAHTRGFDAHRRGDPVMVSIEADRAMVFDADADGKRLV